MRRFAFSTPAVGVMALVTLLPAGPAQKAVQPERAGYVHIVIRGTLGGPGAKSDHAVTWPRLAALPQEAFTISVPPSVPEGKNPDNTVHFRETTFQAALELAGDKDLLEKAQKLVGKSVVVAGVLRTWEMHYPNQTAYANSVKVLDLRPADEPVPSGK